MHNRTAVFAALVATLCACYRPSSFRGGAMSDSGVVSYPRYHATLGAVPLDRPATYTISLSGFPFEEMTLLLCVPGTDHSSRDALKAIATHLRVKLNAVGAGSGCTAEGLLGPDWVLGSGSSRGDAFWQRASTDLPFRRGGSYVLQIEVGAVDPAGRHFSLVPTLEGGGIELP